MKIKSAVQWYPGVTAAGIIEIPPSRVDQSATRGIVFDRAGGFFGVTPHGNEQLAYGDWLITTISGNHYVIKEIDFSFSAFQQRTTFWAKLRGLFR